MPTRPFHVIRVPGAPADRETGGVPVLTVQVPIADGETQEQTEARVKRAIRFGMSDGGGTYFVPATSA